MRDTEPTGAELKSQMNEEFPETWHRILVNNSPVEGNALLKDGDIIAISRVKLEYRGQGFLEA
jgi:hypothetical protein